MELPFFPGKIASKSHVDFGQSSCVHLGDKKKKAEEKDYQVTHLSGTESVSLQEI